MKSEQVTLAWEFYRDNCEGLKEPMREELHRLDDYVASIESENAKLREDLEFERSENGWAREFLNCMGPKCGTKDCPSLVAYVNKLERENTKLRELAVLNWEWAHSCCANSCKMQTDGCGFGIDRECNYEREIADLMRDLGIEVNG